MPAAQVIHQWQGTSRTVSRLAYRAGQNSLRYYFYKHHGRLAQIAIFLMLASKEAAYIITSLFRGRSADRRFHQGMLRELFAPRSQPEAAP